MSDAPFPEGMVDAWEEFLEAPRSRTLDDIFDSGLLFPLQRRVEMERMMEIATLIQPRTYMEIGADKGGGLWAWCQYMPSLRRVIACEIRGVPYRDYFETAFPHIKFLWLPQSSFAEPTVMQVWRWLTSARLPRGDKGNKGDGIDVLFIDGDKSYFKEDFDAYNNVFYNNQKCLMNRPGIVFMHDIQDEVPYNAYWSVHSRGYKHEEIIDTSESMRAVARKEIGVPPATAHEAWLQHWGGRSCGVGVVYLSESK
jgi:hypothetical protein